MSAERINCHADKTFQIDVKIPVAATGDLGAPALGAVTAIRARLSATPTGTAINPAVNDLAASERSGKAGRFAVDVDKALLETHVLPLGVGAPFYVIWSKATDFDMEYLEYRVNDRNAF